MVRNVFLASVIGTALIAAIAPASARGLPVIDDDYCVDCGPRAGVMDPYAEAALRPVYSRNRVEAWNQYGARPYTRFEVEGIRIIERMR